MVMIIFRIILVIIMLIYGYKIIINFRSQDADPHSKRNNIILLIALILFILSFIFEFI